MTATVHLVDDEEGLRKALGNLLEEVGYPAVTYASCESFIEQWPIEQPAVVVVDIYFGGGGMSGRELIRWVRHRDGSIPLIMLTGAPEWGLAQAVHDQVNCLLDKSSHHEVIEAIRRYATVAEDIAAHNERSRKLATLIRNEHPMFILTLKAVVRGKKRQEIARKLHKDPKTVDHHLRRIRETFETDSDVVITRQICEAAKYGGEEAESIIDRLSKQGG